MALADSYTKYLVGLDWIIDTAFSRGGYMMQLTCGGIWLCYNIAGRQLSHEKADVPPFAERAAPKSS